MSTIIREIGQGETTPGIKKTEEREALFQEVLHRIEKIENLFQSIFLGGLTFLGVVVQPAIDAHTGFLLPLALCAIYLKIAKHDLRVGQITFYLRYTLGSCWEIVRRHLFDGKSLTEEEQAILLAQQIVITEQIRERARNLKSPVQLDFWSQVLTALVFAGTSLCIASVKTWRLLLACDPLTICLWTLGYLALLLCIALSVRKRVR